MPFVAFGSDPSSCSVEARSLCQVLRIFKFTQIFNVVYIINVKPPQLSLATLIPLF